MLLGEAAKVLPKFIKENNIGGVVTDFCPLRVPRKWVSEVVEKLPSDVPFCQVSFIVIYLLIYYGNYFYYYLFLKPFTFKKNKLKISMQMNFTHFMLSLQLWFILINGCNS